MNIFLKYIGEELKVITDAPILSGIIFFTGYLIAKWYYKKVINDLKSQTTIIGQKKNNFNYKKELHTTARQEREDLQKMLPPEAIEMLGVIAATLPPFGNNRQETTINWVALSETFGTSHQKTKYLGELLEQADMLEINDFGIYGIKHKGRKLLNEKEKMP